MGIWNNAFKLPVPPELTREERLILDSLAARVRARGMGDMAALALESTRPLHGLGAQGAVFLSPMLSIVFEKEQVAVYVRLLENPNAVSYLTERLAADDGTKKDVQGEANVKERP